MPPAGTDNPDGVRIEAPGGSRLPNEPSGVERAATGAIGHNDEPTQNDGIPPQLFTPWRAQLNGRGIFAGRACPLAVSEVQKPTITVGRMRRK